MPRFIRNRLGLRIPPLSLLLLVVLTTAAGCVGPTALQKTRIRYNESFRRTNDEQLLLNIVCLRYGDSPVFVDLPSITSQFEVSSRNSFTGGRDGSGPGFSNLGIGELFLRDAPTLSYHPREGREMAKALMTPLSTDAIRMARAGMNLEQFLMIVINDINDLNNAPRANDMVPRAPDDNEDYRYLVALMVALADRQAIEFLNVSREEDRSDRVATSTVYGRDLVDAAKDDMVFRSAGDNEHVLLKKKTQELVIRVKAHERDSFEMQEIARLLRLQPGKSEYTIRSEYAETDANELPTPLGEKELVINSRSILQMLTFLSKGVCVPPDHSASRVAPTVLDTDGCPFDWTRVTAGQFRVYHSKHKPKNAEVAIQYKDFWFYIREDDAPSKATLTVIDLLFSLQLTDDAKSGGPVLTLPAGG